MEKLCYQTLADQGYGGYLLPEAPERVLQFGEGGFLRAFAEQFIDEMNEKAGFNSKVVLVQPRGGHPEVSELFDQQQGLYTLILRGRENGQKVSRARVISCVSRCLDPMNDWESLLACAGNRTLRFIISNTTEAGIVFDPECKLSDAPPRSFPGKLTVFLHNRWKRGLNGFVILSCELIDHNGDELRRCVKQYIELWGLEEEFGAWIEKENLFCSTLVDRIVTGYPRAEAAAICEELGYQDNIIDTGEVFGSWVIEGPQSIKKELPFEKVKLPIIVVDDHTPYKQRKVRILNGAHTSMVLGAYLAGEDIVRGCMENEVIRGFMEKTIYNEVIPTLDLPRKDLVEFASAVTERFNNPYIDHSLLAIALNSTAKWKARVMPSLLEYVKRFGKLPACITFSFAAYIAFYHNGKVKGNDCLAGRRDADIYDIKDDQWVLDFYFEHRDDDAASITHAVVNNGKMWGKELAALDGFETAVTAALERINAVGVLQAMEECLE